MFRIANFQKNRNVEILNQQGAFKVIEYEKDMSITLGTAIAAYYASAMNVRKRQVVCSLHQSGVMVQAGAVHWLLGGVHATPGV